MHNNLVDIFDVLVFVCLREYGNETVRIVLLLTYWSLHYPLLFQ